MKRSLVLIGSLAIAASIVLTTATLEGRTHTPDSVVTEVARSSFYGPGPASLGLDVFNIDTVVVGTRVTSRDALGTHTEESWFDQFTLHDIVTDEAVLSCSAGGTLPEHSVGIDANLQLAMLDASASTMQAAGDSTTGWDDNAICPTLSLRVLMQWHGTQAASVNDRARSGNCRASERTVSVPASANGVTLNSPEFTGGSVIPLGPSVSGSIERTITGSGDCRRGG